MKAQRMNPDCSHHRGRRPESAGWIRAGLVALLVGVVVGGCTTREPVLMRSKMHGDAALREGRYADAVREYEIYLERRPGRAGVLYDLGRAYTGMGEASAARESFSVAHELDPENPVYIEALARAMASNGETAGAFEMLERIAVDSQRADAYLRLGSLLLEEGLADEAVLSFHTAAQLRPSVEPYRALAGAYRLFGDDERELGALRHVLWFEAGDRASAERVRELGGVPGPTFASPPAP